MCGIAGVWVTKEQAEATPKTIGESLVKMLSVLQNRGKDSTGVALRVTRAEEETIRYTLATAADSNVEISTTMLNAWPSRIITKWQGRGVLVVECELGDLSLEYLTTRVGQTIKHFGYQIVSINRNLAVFRSLGNVAELLRSFPIETLGVHYGIGHARLATESRVDLVHGQPLSANNHLDLSIVHNGHITNYEKLRRRLEQRGMNFITANDSEAVSLYLAWRIKEGYSLREALEAATVELDGSFSLIVATSNELGVARDKYAFKPLVLAELPDRFVIASEICAISAVVESRDPSVVMQEPKAGEVRVWEMAG